MLVSSSGFSAEHINVDDAADDSESFDVSFECPSCGNPWNQSSYADQGGARVPVKNKAKQGDAIYCDGCKGLFRVVPDGVKPISADDLSLHEAQYLISKGRI